MHDFKEKMLYNLSIVLSALDLLLIASVFLLNLYHYEQTHVMDATWLIISMILILFLFLLRKPLEQMRTNFRMKVNYDEYGRSKKFQSKNVIKAANGI